MGHQMFEYDAQLAEASLSTVGATVAGSVPLDTAADEIRATNWPDSCAHKATVLRRSSISLRHARPAWSHRSPAS